MNQQMWDAVLRLSPTQEAALRLLYRRANVSWASAYELQLSRATLDALVRKGLAIRQDDSSVGAAWAPRVTIGYKISERGVEAIAGDKS